MTITRVGSNEKYAANWDAVFGGKKKTVASSKVGSKTAPKSAKKAAKKGAAPKKKAAPAKPAKKGKK